MIKICILLPFYDLEEHEKAFIDKTVSDLSNGLQAWREHDIRMNIVKSQTAEDLFSKK